MTKPTEDALALRPSRPPVDYAEQQAAAATYIRRHRFDDEAELLTAFDATYQAVDPEAAASP